mgnify:CR=1 FL=1
MSVVPPSTWRSTAARATALRVKADHELTGKVSAFASLTYARRQLTEAVIALPSFTLSTREGSDDTTTAALGLPTLVVAGANDGTTPPDLVRETADLIRGHRWELMRSTGLQRDDVGGHARAVDGGPHGVGVERLEERDRAALAIIASRASQRAIDDLASQRRKSGIR